MVLDRLHLPSHRTRLTQLGGSQGLIVDGLRYQFKSGFELAVDNLHVQAGEFLCVVGQTGSGKSTLLGLLGGHLTPNAGSISYNGLDVGSMLECRREVRTVFQDFGLFPHLSIEAQIKLAASARFNAKHTLASTSSELLELVDIPLERGSHLPKQLSGGQQQRAAIARALAGAPNLLLCDEPMSALHEFMRADLWSRIRSYRADANRTYVVVTHDSEMVRTESTRIIVLHEGQIIAEGNYESLRRNSDNRVAEIIGTAKYPVIA